MNTAATDIRKVRKVRALIDLHVPIVVGAALKLAMIPDEHPAKGGDDNELRRASDLTVYHWELHSSRVLRLAESLRSILPPP